jgi:hypothetical protein
VRSVRRWQAARTIVLLQASIDANKRDGSRLQMTVDLTPGATRTALKRGALQRVPNSRWAARFAVARAQELAARDILGGQAARPISTGKLHALLHFHTRPINHVVYVGSSGALRLGTPYLEGGFPLRCFQRLSLPNIATRRCYWRNNRNTIGSSNSVLSY